MHRLTRRVIGQLRRLRGRCPSCNSTGAAVDQCRTCRGYHGPFPVSEEIQARWLARFEHELGDAAADRPPRATRVISAHS